MVLWFKNLNQRLDKVRASYLEKLLLEKEI